MKALVWSKENCVFCERAKTLLDSKSIEYEERKIGDGWSRDDLLAVVPAARSVPQIFLDNEHVGGFEELKRKLA